MHGDLKLYTESNYKGEFNILKAERKMIVTCLKHTQRVGMASILLGMSRRCLSRRLVAHSIKNKEWKVKKD